MKFVSPSPDVYFRFRDGTLIPPAHRLRSYDHPPRIFVCSSQSAPEVRIADYQPPSFDPEHDVMFEWGLDARRALAPCQDA